MLPDPGRGMKFSDDTGQGACCLHRSIAPGFVVASRSCLMCAARLHGPSGLDNDERLNPTVKECRVVLKHWGSLRGLGVAWAIAAVALALVACGDEDAATPDLSATSGACLEKSWRNPTPGTVACPGTEACGCPSSEVCCISQLPDNQLTGKCSALTACTDAALVCDGPEDCGSGEVCCLDGLIGQCVPDGDCFFGMRACRDNSDCRFATQDCLPGEDGSYFGDTIATCR